MVKASPSPRHSKFPHSTSLSMTLVCRFNAMGSSSFAQDRTDGSPLGLEEIMNTSLLRHHALPETQATSFALFQQDALFPLLSQGDHPTSGLPSWFIHPCGTACAMSELIGEKTAEGMAEVGSTEWLSVWLETWFMMLGNMVRL